MFLPKYVQKVSFFLLLKIIVEKWYVVNRILNYDDIKLMLFWNGVNVIQSITFLLQYIKISVQKII